ncbi:Methionine aminopeptidase 1D, mitochondrial [Armadillidium nasatum]|uniref:Methionine aminopeptidase 1D, mitochondrial n=1 Tax=Armadillidium nasatum TaxID=96803 RepID=A0A5N5TIA6_9CRUS|nr:Methionine aminopeptidase 1D, mitochondrial [Armadillidium nasatum]
MSNILLKIKRVLIAEFLTFKSFSMKYSCCQKSSILTTNYSRKHFRGFDTCNSFGNLFFKNYFYQSFRRSKFGNYTVIKKPSEVIDSLPVPSHIIKPSYAETGVPSISPPLPEIKNEIQIKGVLEACQRARDVLNAVAQNIKVGLTTEEIDIIVREKSFENDCYPSPLNYRGFPKSCCTSVNNIACHGIPDTRALEDGDIISVDVTIEKKEPYKKFCKLSLSEIEVIHFPIFIKVYYKGFHGDCCETFLVGNVDDKGKHLVNISKQCRDSAISICGPGVPFSDIGSEIDGLAKEEKLSVVPAFIGHGIGHYFHGPPDIYHFCNQMPGLMKAGMTFTVEPVLAQGSKEALILEDGWTVVMLDDSRAAQFEHTILITDNGHQILTYY